MKTFILWLALVSGDGSVTITPTSYDSAAECAAWALATTGITLQGGVTAEAWCVEETYA